MIDFLEIILILLAVIVFGFCFYHQGKRDAHSQASFDLMEDQMDRLFLKQIKAGVHNDVRLDTLESITVDLSKLGDVQISWNTAMRAQVEAMAAQECQRRQFTKGDVEFLYLQMSLMDKCHHQPERIARGEDN